MAAADVDEYMLGVEEPKRATLQTLRNTILEILPELPADQMRRLRQAASGSSVCSTRSPQS